MFINTFTGLIQTNIVNICANISFFSKIELAFMICDLIFYHDFYEFK